MRHVRIKSNGCMEQNIRVYGIVQGVGFRPFVSRIADACGIKGSVANKGSYVEIFAQGSQEQLDSFHRELSENPPERSAILKIDTKEIPMKQFRRFDIIESEKEEGDIFVSPDIATCPKCIEELYDKNNRRYMHPFINCTACGPRLTILDAMPYDRERTSMGEFPMCPECEYEYTHAETRRYDAQPVCCNDCGPEVYLINRPERGREAITYARKAIMDGQIVAVKGIGGFHLCCDATNEEAVQRLRTLKRRPAKPFAIMMKNRETARRECQISPEQERELDGHQKPIILFPKKKGGHLAPSVAPDNPKVGVMLPYAPVQMLLFDYDDELSLSTDCFVMTSGNVSGAPICRTDEDACSQLSDFCDVMLSHNRKIRLRADDTVMDYYQDKPYMIRRSRGYAPLPFMVSNEYTGQVLAVGGELKNTFCIGKKQLFYQSPYVGDMADMRTVEALKESIVRMEELLEASPSIVACDMHPRYNTTYVANEQNLPVLQVQHHFAHIVSCMAENDHPQPVIGVSFDGTGYGTDGSIWGGEIFLCDYLGFERVGHIRPFQQIGGDASSREGWRIAAAMINRIYQDQAGPVIAQLNLCDEITRQLYRKMGEQGINTVKSTSAGRLFDGISAILDIRKYSTFEGEAATTLEFAAERYLDQKKTIEHPGIKEVPIHPQVEEGIAVLPTEEIVKYIIKGKLNGRSVDQLAYEFHVLLAEQIAAACDHVAERRSFTREDGTIMELPQGTRTCALSGGVFQNKLLLSLCDQRLQERGYNVLKHSLLPPNDGGIALGQAVTAMAYIEEKGRM